MSGDEDFLGVRGAVWLSERALYVDPAPCLRRAKNRITEVSEATARAHAHTFTRVPQIEVLAGSRSPISRQLYALATGLCVCSHRYLGLPPR